CIELVEDDGRPVTATPNPVRIHHVVVAVEVDDDAIATWRDAFGFVPAPEGPDGLLLRHHVPVGDTWFGLTSVGTNPTAVRRFVARRGEGFFALSLVVPDRTAAVARARGQGCEIVGDDDAAQIWVHPRSLHGVLLELAPEWPGGIRRPPTGSST